MALHPSEAWVAVANYASGTVTVHAREDGRLRDAHVVVAPAGPHGKAHQVLFSRDGTRLFVPCLGADYIAQFHFDTATGTLTPAVSPHAAVAKGAGPRHVVFTPDERRAIVINEVDCTVTLFDVDAAGWLVGGRSTSTLPSDQPLLDGYSTAAIKVSRDGRFAYGSNRGHNSIVVYAIADTLEPLQWLSDAIDKPRDFELSNDPTQAFVLCANQNGISVVCRRCI